MSKVGRGAVAALLSDIDGFVVCESRALGSAGNGAAGDAQPNGGHGPA